MDLTQENVIEQDKMEIQEEFPNKFNCAYVRKHKTHQYTGNKRIYKEIKTVKKIRFCKDKKTQRGKKGRRKMLVSH